MTKTAQYSDLKTRMLSALVMAVIAGVSFWQGGLLFQCTLLIVGFCIIWELTGFSSADQGRRAAVSAVLGLRFGLAGLWPWAYLPPA